MMNLRLLLFIGVLSASGAQADIFTEEPIDLEAFPGSIYPTQRAEDETSAPDLQGNNDLGTVAMSIQAALDFDPAIKTALSNRDQAASGRIRALGGFLPNVEANLTYTDDSWRSSSLPTLVDSDGTTLGLTTVQPIFNGTATYNGYRAARAEFSAAKANLVAAQQLTAFKAAATHAAVILARETVAYRIENLSLVNRQYEIADRRQKAGAQSVTGVQQALMRRSEAQVALNEARARLAREDAAYRRITGLAPPTELKAALIEDLHGYKTVDDALAAARNLNPAIKAATASAKATKFSKNAAIGGFAPRVTIEASYFKRYGSSAIAPASDEEYQVVARMRMPIFRQGQNIASLKSANASVTAQHAALIDTELATDESVSRNWGLWLEAIAKRRAAQQAIQAAKHSVKGLQLEYEAGQRTIIDVLDGQRDLVRSQISLSQAEYELRISQYDLMTATGIILERFDLTANNARE